ncbi:MAG: FAD-binding protein, partial [Elusimicrobiaceae bacterium]|nr:FAD-binding protein [Elusimicrobiaceae bacterium]
MKILTTDCLVIGAGIAGCVYAHQAAKKGLKTMLLCCGEMSQANSDLAQGGIVYEPHLQLDELLQDVQLATAHMCNNEAVREISVAGCKAVEEIFLKDVNVNFDRDAQHQLRFTREGAHRKNRIIYSKDTTGHAMLSALQTAVHNNPCVTVKEFCSAIDLLTLSHSSTNLMDRYYPLTVFG